MSSEILIQDLLYLKHGAIYSIESIAKCLEIVAKEYSLTVEEVVNISNEFLSKEKQPKKVDDPNFIYEDYDINIDDQAINKVKTENQAYLNKKYNAINRFPKF